MTGGTICSFKNSTGYNAADVVKAAPLLIDVLRNSESRARDAEFDVIKPLDTLSENMSVEKWNILLDSLRETDISSYAGIIIAHGTDTLHLTAALIARVLKGCQIPVGFAASQKSLEDEAANGRDNFINTVELILMADKQKGYLPAQIGNTFVIYRNSDGISYIHSAAELEKCRDFSDDFTSRGMKKLTDIYDGLDVGKQLNINDSTDMDILSYKNNCADKNGLSDKSDSGDENKSKGMLLYSMGRLRETVLMITPYVGINYDNYDISRVKHVLHLTYHSGTADAEKLPDFIRKCREEGVDFYLAPVPENYAYSSTKILIDAGAIPVSGKTPGAVYAELLIRDAVDKYTFLGG